MVKGLPKMTSPTIVCTDCMKGKQHRDAIPKKSQWRDTQKLQLVHADICGPITPASNSNKKYILNGCIQIGEENLTLWSLINSAFKMG